MGGKMRYRTLGKTNISASAVVLGTWAIGGGPGGLIQNRLYETTIKYLAELAEHTEPF
jgi:aryl-alcohol dehydrogenase-like predicted oxidoreductase